MRPNYKIKRLYIAADLVYGADIGLTAQQAHYLLVVLRMKDGDSLFVFNGRQGEWRAKIAIKNKKKPRILIIEQERDQPRPTDIIYCFAPLKHARLDYLVQKAVEMGVAQLNPIVTEFTQNHRVNIERITANIIEAAEQCGILALPTCKPCQGLGTLLDNWQPSIPLFYCDEAQQPNNPLTIFANYSKGPVGIIVGPEGGFSDSERALLKRFAFVIPISLGPRILRADTAAVVALTLIGVTLGDW